MIRAFDIRHSGVETLKLGEHCSKAQCWVWTMNGGWDLFLSSTSFSDCIG